MKSPSPGESGGCSIRLVPLNESGTLGVAEGLETALACWQATGIPVWSCISAGGLAGFKYPKGISKLIIFADNDEAGIKAAQILKWRAVTKNLAVKLLIPPEPGTDWDDFQNMEGNK